MDSKTDLRLLAKRIRRTLDMETLSANIVDKIRHNSLYKSARCVMLYYPCKFEIDLRDLLSDEKKFFLPKVLNDKILVCPYSSGDKLEVSSFNIKEPCSNPISASNLDLVIVPALMADRRGYRLGYGGGFYDRFLSENKISTIVPIAKSLLVNELPIEDFDVPLDCIITD